MLLIVIPGLNSFQNCYQNFQFMLIMPSCTKPHVFYLSIGFADNSPAVGLTRIMQFQHLNLILRTLITYCVHKFLLCKL